MKRFPCTVPWLDGRPLINATGSTEAEAKANIGLLDLTDEELKRVEFVDAELAVDRRETADA